MNVLHATFEPFESGGLARLLIRMSDPITDIIRRSTKCPSDRIGNYIAPDGSIYFSYKNEERASIDASIPVFMHIANEMPQNELLRTILTDNSRDMMPAEMHRIMRERYGLHDDIEWYVSLMFLKVGGLITEPLFCYRTIEEDIEAGDCDVFIISPHE